MEKKQRRVGYPTPSNEIEDAFLKIKEQLSTNEADWQIIVEVLEGLNRSLLNGLRPRKIHLDQLIVICFGLTNLLVAQLGVESAEVHSRLAKVERAVKDLKLVK